MNEGRPGGRSEPLTYSWTLLALSKLGGLRGHDLNDRPIQITFLLYVDANSAHILIMTHIWQSDVWPHFDYDRMATEPYLAAAVEVLGEVQGLHAGLQVPDVEELKLKQVVQEALASFGIEGVSLDESEIEASVIASLKHRNRIAPSRRTDAIVELMLAARNTTAPLSWNMLCDWHRLLFFGVEIEDLGRRRQFDIEIVRSAAAGSTEVLYKAPRPENVAAEMATFLAWLANGPLMPTPVVAAIAHLWFESIHPFSDGNGRIGRAIIENVFARSRALPFSLSRQIEKDKKAYYAALQAGRCVGDGVIDATAFVIWFLQCLERAAESGREEALFIVRKNLFWSKFNSVLSVRQQNVLRVIFGQGADRVAQGLSARSYGKIAKVSGPTATRDLVAMERTESVSRSNAGGRSTVYNINF